MNTYSAIILCGGKSTRMGFDKQNIKINNKLIVLNIASQLEPYVNEIVIVTNKPKLYCGYGYKVVEDIIKNCGPMAGIYSGLINSDNHYSYVIGGDMPFINGDYIQYLYSEINNSEKDIDIFAIKNKERIEPFHAIYSKNLCPIIYKYLCDKNYCLYKLFENVNVKYINEEKLLKYDPNKKIFTNLNTVSDFQSLEM